MSLHNKTEPDCTVPRFCGLASYIIRGDLTVLFRVSYKLEISFRYTFEFSQFAISGLLPPVHCVSVLAATLQRAVNVK